MKTKIFLILSLVMALGLVGCTSDNESNSVQENTFKEFKTKYYAIAEEYGVKENIADSDDVLRSKKNWTNEQIEKEMKFIASVKGTYHGVRHGNTFHLMKKNRTRSFDSEHEAWEGSVSELYFEFEVGFDFYYDPFGGRDDVRLTTFNYQSFDQSYTLMDFEVSNVLFNILGDHSFTYNAHIYKKCVGEWDLVATCSEDELTVTLL